MKKEKSKEERIRAVLKLFDQIDNDPELKRDLQRLQKMRPILEEFENCECLEKDEKDILIDFIREKHGEKMIKRFKKLINSMDTQIPDFDGIPKDINAYDFAQELLLKIDNIEYK